MFGPSDLPYLMHPPGTVHRVRATLARGALAAFLVAPPAPTLAQSASATARRDNIDLLRLGEAAAGRALPAPWKSRAVRGHRLPNAQVIDSAGDRFLRLSGTGQAGWFGTELRTPVSALGGRLSWQWRVPVAPAGADVAAPASDDAALRVFVVFARHSRFAVVPRTIFYTVSIGAAPDRGPHPPALATIVIGSPAVTRQWTTVATNPFLDYRRLWGEEPPRIAAVGVMQDTDQTKAPAIGDLRDLHWSYPDVAFP